MSRQEARAASEKAIGRRVAALAALLLAGGCEQAPTEPRVSVDDAVVTLPAVAGRPGAAYFTLRTNTDPTRLVGIDSAGVGRIELHETVSAGGVSRMAPLASSAFSSNAPLVFAPGGRHAMLLDVQRSLRPGDRLGLTFRFDAAPPVTVLAEVRGPGGAGDAQH